MLKAQCLIVANLAGCCIAALQCVLAEVELNLSKHRTKPESMVRELVLATQKQQPNFWCGYSCITTWPRKSGLR